MSLIVYHCTTPPDLVIIYKFPLACSPGSPPKMCTVIANAFEIDLKWEQLLILWTLGDDSIEAKKKGFNSTSLYLHQVINKTTKQWLFISTVEETIDC